MPYQLALTTAPTGGVLIADLTPFVTSCTISTNEHGPQELRATVPRSLYDAFRVYDAPGTLHVQLNDGAWPLWVGRLEEPGLRAGAGGALEISAFGYWRALSDLPYTALWSTTSYEAFRPITEAEISNRSPARYAADTNNRLFFGPQKNASYANLADDFSYIYIPPSGGSRLLIGVQFTYSITMPLGWTLRCMAHDLFDQNAITVFTINSTGVAQNGAIHATFAGRQSIYFDMFNSSGGTLTYTGETGANFYRITNLRVVTSTANRINTTLTAARAAGTNVTATVGSTAGMYVGQQLVINTAASPSEVVTVLSIGSATQFNATFANSYVAGQSVTGHQVYASEIVGDLVSTVAATNPTQLQSTASLITSPNRDIVDAVYEDQYPADIITALCQQGDSTGAQFEAGIDSQRRVYFRQVGSQARRWYVDVADLQLNRSLDGLRNSAYTVYADASGTPVRTASATNAASVVRYGLTRRQAVALQTTNSTYATAVRDAEVAANALVQPRAAFTVRAVYDANSARAPLAYVQAGDYLVLRNLPPTASSTIDSIRTFRITRTEYDPFSDSLSIEPEAPATTLDALVGGQL